MSVGEHVWRTGALTQSTTTAHLFSSTSIDFYNDRSISGYALKDKAEELLLEWLSHSIALLLALPLCHNSGKGTDQNKW